MKKTRPTSTRATATLLAAFGLITAQAASAQTLYWDTNGDTAGAGVTATGTWNASNTNWTTDSTGSSATVAYTAGSNVVFAAGSDLTSATVTMSSPGTVNSFTFLQGNITLGGSGLSVVTATATNITVAAGATVAFNVGNTFNGIFEINGTFTGNSFTGGNATTINGTGTSTFNRLDASLTVNGGTVNVSGGKLKNTTVNSGGTLRSIGDTFDGNNRSLTVNSGGRFEVAAGFTDNINVFSGAGTFHGDLNSSINIGSNNGSSTLSGQITGDLTLNKIGTGTFTLSGASISTGDVNVSAGTYTLANGSSFTFYIGENGVNNSVTGLGTANFNGAFLFDLSGASLADGNSWTIASVASQSFGGTFSVGGGFEYDAINDIWTNGLGFSFSETTGLLTYSVIPEPSSAAALAGLGVLGLVALRRRRRA